MIVKKSRVIFYVGNVGIWKHGALGVRLGPMDTGRNDQNVISTGNELCKHVAKVR